MLEMWMERQADPKAGYYQFFRDALRPDPNFLLFLHLFSLSFLCSFLCPTSSGGSGRKEQGSPTMAQRKLGLPCQLAVCSRINIKDNTHIYMKNHSVTLVSIY